MGTGPPPQRTARPGGTAAPGSPVGPGGSALAVGAGPGIPRYPGADAHLGGIRSLEALARQLLARGGARVAVLGQPLPPIQRPCARRPHGAHANGGDAGGSHDARHAGWAHGGAAGASMWQELAAEGLPGAHLRWERGVVTAGRPPAPRLYRGRALTAPYWLSSWLCFSCSAATVAVAVAVAVAAAAATAAAAAAWVKSAGGRPACDGSPIPPGPPGLLA